VVIEKINALILASRICDLAPVDGRSLHKVRLNFRIVVFLIMKGYIETEVYEFLCDGNFELAVMVDNLNSTSRIGY
jgi:hypothetical protein